MLCGLDRDGQGPTDLRPAAHSKVIELGRAKVHRALGVISAAKVVNRPQRLRRRGRGVAEPSKPEILHSGAMGLCARPRSRGAGRRGDVPRRIGSMAVSECRVPLVRDEPARRRVAGLRGLTLTALLLLVLCFALSLGVKRRAARGLLVLRLLALLQLRDHRAGLRGHQADHRASPLTFIAYSSCHAVSR